jgi:hypothetical protein
MGRDNIPGINGNRPKRVFLLPGMILQWFMNVFVAGDSYSVIRRDWPAARCVVVSSLTRPVSALQNCANRQGGVGCAVEVVLTLC